MSGKARSTGAPASQAARAGRRRWAVAGCAVALGAAGAGCGHGESKPAAGAAGAHKAPAARRAALEALHRQVAASLAQPSQEAYGSLPAYLASRQGDPDRVQLATPKRPARTAQGKAIRLRLAAGDATATALGPIVPRRLIGTDVPVAPASFTVTFDGLHGHVPLRTSLFGILDEHGAIHIPKVRVTRRGAKALVHVKVLLPTGNGRIVYAPTGRPLATWDYTLEVD